MEISTVCIHLLVLPKRLSQIHKFGNFTVGRKPMRQSHAHIRCIEYAQARHNTHVDNSDTDLMLQPDYEIYECRSPYTWIMAH